MFFEWMNDHRYVCPLLMVAQGIIKRQRWRYGCNGWSLMQSKYAAASCMWPRWVVEVECKFWNSTMGIKLRARMGSQQREYRINLQRTRDAWQRAAARAGDARDALQKAADAKEEQQ